jgi:asparagine synthase (glutamine-hydrolysing)
MNRRFLALRCSAGIQNHRPAGWHSRQVGDVCVFASPATPTIAFRDELLIVGDLFGADFGRVPASDPGIALSIIASDGRWLAEQGWGRFAAIWKDRRGSGLWIYRDPSGHVPVYLHDGGVLLAFSDLDDARAFLPGRLSFDADGLAHRLVYSQLQTRRTGLEHVEELLPGERSGLTQPAPDLLWSPWPFAQMAGDSRAGHAPDPAALKSVILRTVQALVSGKDRALLELSGGLDSSILAASLATVGAKWLALTVVTPGPEGDERGWASPVAERLHTELHTAIVDADFDDLFALPSRLTPNPGGFSMLRPADRAVAAAARELSADALVSGTGGDNVFCSLRSPAPVIDGWRIGGLADALRAGRDLARITRTGPWEVAHQTRAYLKMERTSPTRWRASHDLLATDCRPSFAGHPWLDSPRRRLAGSRAQVVMLLRAQAVTAAHDRTRSHDMIFPLLAQPILEACLAIASPHWIARGQDRSVAREAFRQDLPARTIGRRSKGRRDGLVARVFDQHRRKIGECLVDGRLAAAGLIDRAAICATAARPSSPDDRYMRLLELLDAELWLTSIESYRPDA